MNTDADVDDRTDDPVCGMSVSPRSAKGSSDFDGRTFYFCSASCKRSFDEDPARFVRPHLLRRRLALPSR